MFTAEELKFAEKYPFSGTAKRIVKENSFSFEHIPEPVQRQALYLVFLSFKGKPLEQKAALFDSDLLLAEIQAFPLAKIFLSLMNRKELYSRFASMIAKKTFYNLAMEKKKNDAMITLAEDLEIRFVVSERKDTVAEIDLIDFLKADFSEQFMKLCNQRVEKGKVFLNQNDFARFLAAFAQKKIFDSLPVQTDGLPKKLKQLVQEVSTKLANHSFKEFDYTVSKNVSPNAFSDCIAALYNDLLSGKNLPHLARFDLAVFLAAIGMPKEQIVNAFRKAPNFNEKTTRYQIEKILQKKYKPVSCEKMREHGLACTNCGYKHPFSFYRAQLKRQKQSTGSQSQSNSIIVVKATGDKG
jgi:DNA primase large subunit